MIDINCDMGEGMHNEAELMPYINAANIACGGHAGDDATMRAVVALCRKYQVHIGAHPSYPDRENFGRTDMELPPDELYRSIAEQIETLQKIATEFKTALHHVKPHGALYNRAAKDPQVAGIIAKAVKDTDANLVLYGLSGSHMITEAKALGLRTANEVFADRSYQPDGSLTPRSQAGALISDPEKAVMQVKQMVLEEKVNTAGGQSIPIKAETVCIHGDGAHAVAIAQAIYDALSKTGQR